jgi:hypothetical protein
MIGNIENGIHILGLVQGTVSYQEMVLNLF